MGNEELLQRFEAWLEAGRKGDGVHADVEHFDELIESLMHYDDEGNAIECRETRENWMAAFLLLELTQLRADKAELLEALNEAADQLKITAEFLQFEMGECGTVTGTFFAESQARASIAKHRPTPPIVQEQTEAPEIFPGVRAELAGLTIMPESSGSPLVDELEQADKLDAAEDVLAENLAACDAGKVDPVVTFPHPPTTEELQAARMAPVDDEGDEDDEDEHQTPDDPDYEWDHREEA